MDNKGKQKVPGVKEGDLKSINVGHLLGNSDLVTFNLSLGVVDGKTLQQRFRKSISDVRGVASEGGTLFCDKPVTYDDEERVCFIFTVIEGDQTTTRFIIRKSDLYILSFSTKADTWVLLKDSGITLAGHNFNIEESGLTIHYKKPKDKHGKVPDECDRLISEVGPYVLLKALKALRTDDSLVQQYAFYCVCHHIAESSRFNNIENSVATSMKEMTNRTLTKNERLYFNKWSTISGFVRDSVVEAVKPDPNVIDFCEDEPKAVMKHLSLVLVERDEVRRIRRDGVQKDNREKFPSFKLVSCTSIRQRLLKKKSAPITMTRDSLLATLMRRGGRPDTWNCLARAARCLRIRNGFISKRIMQNTDLRFVVSTTDLARSFDDTGFEYTISDEEFDLLTK